MARHIEIKARIAGTTDIARRSGRHPLRAKAGLPSLSSR
jgi:hypothetical protein